MMKGTESMDSNTLAGNAVKLAEEIQSGETRDLDALKDKSIFVGAEEK